MLLVKSGVIKLGQFLTEQRYGVSASCQLEQHGGTSYCNQSGTRQPNIDVLEFFDPNLTADPFRWIPKGLMLDLMDDNEPLASHVSDQVSGYTTQQIFGALTSDVTSVQQYRIKILSLYGTTQQTNLINLFASYNY